MSLPLKHIGNLMAICDRRKRANLREDLGAERYKQLGVKERLEGETPYKVCPRCIAKLATIFEDTRRYRLRRDRRLKRT